MTDTGIFDPNNLTFKQEKSLELIALKIWAKRAALITSDKELSPEKAKEELIKFVKSKSMNVVQWLQAHGLHSMPPIYFSNKDNIWYWATRAQRRHEEQQELRNRKRLRAKIKKVDPQQFMPEKSKLTIEEGSGLSVGPEKEINVADL
jgi:hypothetical protein